MLLLRDVYLCSWRTNLQDVLTATKKSSQRKCATNEKGCVPTLGSAFTRKTKQGSNQQIDTFCVRIFSASSSTCSLKADSKRSTWSSDSSSPSPCCSSVTFNWYFLFSCRAISSRAFLFVSADWTSCWSFPKSSKKGLCRHIGGSTAWRSGATPTRTFFLPRRQRRILLATGWTGLCAPSPTLRR